MEKYTTGCGQKLMVHDLADCQSRGGHCPIHNPSNHHMVNWPTHWRDDRGMMERICPHGVGHPDPDDPKATINGNDIHGCDGCCQVNRK